MDHNQTWYMKKSLQKILKWYLFETWVELDLGRYFFPEKRVQKRLLVHFRNGDN